MKRLGNALGQQLHLWSYLAATFAILHFTLRVKKDVTEPVVYGLVIAVLLAIRAATWARARRAVP